MSYKKSMMKRFVLLAIAIGITLFSCQEAKEKKTEGAMEEKQDLTTVEIITNVMDFVMPDTIYSGWNTFVYENKSNEPHFFLVEKYPAGKGIEDFKEYVIPPFQAGMTKIMEGKGEEAGAEFGKLPEWYQQVQFLGGSGIVSPKHTSVTFLTLEPGTYLMECYMKMKGGIFHSGMGMVREFTVVPREGEDSMAVEADHMITISGEKGIVLSDSAFSSGEKDFKVTYEDQKVHENFVGHDVNIAEITTEANLDSLEAWMNWAAPSGLLEAAPEGVTFLGGVNDMPAGGQGYFTVDLKPGSRYVLVSEVPNTRSKNMLVTFDVQ